MSHFTHVFSFDPGDKRNGFCYFKYDKEEKKADVKIMEILTPDELDERLKLVWGISTGKAENEKPEIIFVYENFRVDTKIRNAKFQWSEMETIQAIGKIRLAAHFIDCRVVKQEAAILSIARKWVPFKVNSGHLRDDHSAFMHGAHYMMNIAKWFPTTDSITFFGQESL